MCRAAAERRRGTHWQAWVAVSMMSSNKTRLWASWPGRMYSCRGAGPHQSGSAMVLAGDSSSWSNVGGERHRVEGASVAKWWGQNTGPEEVRRRAQNAVCRTGGRKKKRKPAKARGPTTQTVCQQNWGHGARRHVHRASNPLRRRVQVAWGTRRGGGGAGGWRRPRSGGAVKKERHTRHGPSANPCPPQKKIGQRQDATHTTGQGMHTVT